MLWLAVFTVGVWARPVLGGFGHLRLSNPGDSNAFEFYLAWNVHALVNGQDPFYTHVMYAPEGLDLGNAISIPGPSLLVAPVTLLFGGTAGYNVAFLLPIVLAAVATYLLAIELGANRIGALLAGSLVVVAPYFAGHGLGHMNLMWIFGLPAIAWLVARHVNGRLRLRWLACGVAVVIAFTLASSSELFVTQIAFGLVAWAVALVIAEQRHRRPLVRAGIATVCGGIGGLVLGAPVIYASFRSGIPETAANPVRSYPADLTNLLAPTELMEFGSRTFAPLRSTWLGNGAENTAYLTVPLIVFVLCVLWVARGSRRLVALLVFGAIALVCSFGPSLTIAGKPTVDMPWLVATHLPVIEHALPVRFSSFVWMAAALLVALVWTSRQLPRLLTGVLAVLAVVLVLPNLTAMTFPVDTSVPAYFADGHWRKDIDAGDNVLVLAPGEMGPGLRWSEATGFAFNTPTGNGGGASLPEALEDPTGMALFQAQFDPTIDYDWKTNLPGFLQRTEVELVLIDAADRFWRGVMDEIYPGVGRATEGVVVYDIPELSGSASP
ncbi:hypothetical protein [Nocardioides nitrophenolicus]|uniref:hypothetical protein n=1 Tax=Nocardioides nitrophenolicus TaxID=60489 RepID=UPI0019571D3C|nr:hypothetical protein [Nocardioides nitrophenolicus]MBM7519383.1 hypothetical protein [Nocardioides nitrophenolicus]